MRSITIKEATDSKALHALLLKANLSAQQTEKAIASLKALNPQVDLDKVKAGTVLLVPDMPSFKVSASTSVLGDALGEFQQVVRAALTSTAANLRTSTAARAAERADIMAALNGAPLKGVTDKDPALKQQVGKARDALKQEEKESAGAEDVLTNMTKAALGKIADLRKQKG